MVAAGTGAIASGSLRYQAFEPVSEMAVLDGAEVAVLRYQARIGQYVV